MESGGAPSSGLAAAARPQGKDWFVRAGAQGGDGSKDKPFKDPYQALEKYSRVIRFTVTEGEYNGKLKAGNWAIPTTYIALIGGYDTDFQDAQPMETPNAIADGR